jgi:uncharacterized membrane protein YphA (DoxX/SURF4 family)
MTICPQVGFLDYILCIFISPYDRAADSEEPLIVSAHQDFKHIPFTRQHPGHNLVVRDGAILGNRQGIHWRCADHGYGLLTQFWVSAQSSGSIGSIVFAFCNVYPQWNSVQVRIPIEEKYSMQQLDRRLNYSWWLLRIGFGLVPILAGLDKFLNLLADWPTYLSPVVQGVLPIGAASFMHLVGVVEIIAGLIVLSRWTRVGSYIVAAWLVAIALNLMTTGHFFDIAVRDLVMAAAAYSLGQLTAVREGVPETGHARDGIQCGTVKTA